MLLALSIQAPFIHMVLDGIKTIELRSRPPSANLLSAPRVLLYEPVGHQLYDSMPDNVLCSLDLERCRPKCVIGECRITGSETHSLSTVSRLACQAGFYSTDKLPAQYVHAWHLADAVWWPKAIPFGEIYHTQPRVIFPVSQVDPRKEPPSLYNIYIYI